MTRWLAVVLLAPVAGAAVSLNTDQGRQDVTRRRES